ncbi:protein-L-isoaspartate(D-aspartate) O-methyltransferase [Nonomuraea sp. PA05]|uniref:class I SAM-dependent methyltransferase n=1 Tax=Nonomuraea sp. PA05 TaxID=2604466 RepID=UPI0011D780CD|nr:class I SAM-dependent methyltransferase [Nonomuraea sp. PA05]TYB54768.1 protein-L-isoaspartate(D-aspartate) O-methyltransferase [Nonomuraea sp. PA05]
MGDPASEGVERLARYVEGLGGNPAWVMDAFRAVPRHLFVPAVAFATPDDVPVVIDRDADPGTWWDTVYSKEPIITQLDDGATDLRTAVGAYTSSSSAPATVAELLRVLDPEPGDSVLEVGTGTGWTAALLSHVVGEHGRVTSIEVDASVAEQAAKNLGDAGFHPVLLVGDGADGCAHFAPYDRVHVTCGIRRVPYAWVEQCRPGGVIVAPFSPGVGEEFVLRLRVSRDGTALGRFPGFAYYMRMRSQRPISHVPDDGTGRYVPTAVHPRTIGLAPPGADLAMSALTGLHAHVSREEDRFVVYVRDPDHADRWAAATHRRGSRDHEVYQMGDRPLWEELLDAYFRWVSWGEPGPERFGMTVTSGGEQLIWLDTPERVLRHDLPRE